MTTANNSKALLLELNDRNQGLKELSLKVPEFHLSKFCEETRAMSGVISVEVAK